MTEQPNVPDQSTQADESPAESSGSQGHPHGAVRTQGETAVDDAIGTGDNVH